MTPTHTPHTDPDNGSGPSHPPTEPDGTGTLGILWRELWPRTIRSALASALLPWLRARSQRRRIDAGIAICNFPPALTALTSNIVHATRLWPEERADVARELCTHFADGIAAGRPAEKLMSDFGDPKKAAALIRQAKMRCRPLWWKSFRWFARSTTALVLVVIVGYAWLFARFYLGSPTIGHNYLAEINVPILKIPEQERAWPLYIQAVRENGTFPAFYEKEEWPLSPQSPNWAEGLAYLNSHQKGLSLIRQAAAMKSLGFVYSDGSDPEYSKALEVRSPGYKFDPSLETHSENPALIGVLLPYLGELRHNARLLRFDANVAAHEQDSKRFAADIEAILGLADQCCHSGFFIDTLVAIAIGQVACDTALEHIGEPKLLSDQDFQRLAHRFACLGRGRIAFNPSYEHMSLEDLLQRFFTDNGSGDGHMIAAHLHEFYGNFGIQDPTGRFIYRTIQPVRTAAVPSRAKIHALVDSFIASIQHDDALPLWKNDERSDGREQKQVYAALNFIFPFDSFTGGADNIFSQQFAARDLFEAKRAAVLTALALESFKRANGTYPANLNALVPTYLPTVPADPFDGRPLRYTLKGDGFDGRPLLYSVGVDLKDDGGTPPPLAPPNPTLPAKDQGSITDASKLALFKGTRPATPAEAKAMENCRGDWILYPPPPLPPKPKNAGSQ